MCPVLYDVMQVKEGCCEMDESKELPSTEAASISKSHKLSDKWMRWH